MKESVLMIFGILCLFNVGLSNSSPTPSDSDYEDYGETAADSSYGEYDYDTSYDIADFAGQNNCQTIFCERPKTNRCKKQHEERGCPYDINTICNTMKCPGRPGGGGKGPNPGSGNRTGAGGGGKGKSPQKMKSCEGNQ